jgi:2-methylcitrate dehydratase PrpD
VLSGGLRLELLDVIGPIRFGMPLSFAVAEYAGDLRMTAHFDRQRLSSEQVQALVRRIEQQVKAIGS